MKTAARTTHSATVEPAVATTEQTLNVEAVPAERASGPAVRLKVGEASQTEIVLSLEQARALSLAIIAAVNRQEQNTHTRRKQARLSVAAQPADR